MGPFQKIRSACPFLRGASIHRRFSSRLWLFWTSLSLTLGAPLRADIPGTPEEFAAQVGRAVRLKQIQTLERLTSPPALNDWRWVRHTSNLLGTPPPWQSGLLRLPGKTGDQPAAYVTVSRYHPLQTTSDHLYPLVRTPEGYRLGQEIPDTSTGGYRVRDHRLRVRLEVSSGEAQIHNRIVVERGRAALPAAVLRLNAIYRVTAAKRDGKPIRFHQSGGFLALPPPERERAVYDLAYRAKIAGLSADFILPREAALTSYWYPHTARLPATHRVEISVPSGWTAIGQGERIGWRIAGSRILYTYHNRLPVCFFTITAGRYHTYRMRVNGRQYAAYLLQDSPVRARQAMQVAAKAVDWFDRNLSAYPYSGYAVVESDGLPYALECYSFTIANRSLIPSAIVHEVAHTWWGGIVPNTYLRSLWNESLAEYSDGLHTRRTGNVGMHDWMPGLLVAQNWTHLTEASVLQANDALNATHSLIGYGKGSLVLDQLERLVGVPKMLAVMRRFLQRHTPGEPAEWRDFVRAAEETLGSEWEGYFDAWLTRTDLPSLSLRNVRMKQEGETYRISGEVVQRRPGFWFPLPLLMRTEQGEERALLTVREAVTPFEVAVTARPEEIALDPEWSVLREPGDPSLLATLQSLRNVRGRLLVICATGGDDEHDLYHSVIGRSLRANYLPYAEVLVTLDHSVTQEQMERSHLFLIGRPEHLKLPEEWKRAIPLSYEKDAISGGGRRWEGDDLWGLSVMLHPRRSDLLLAHAAGTGTTGIRMFTLNDPLDGNQSLFVVQGGQNVLLSERVRSSDPTVYRFKP